MENIPYYIILIGAAITTLISIDLKKDERREDILLTSIFIIYFLFASLRGNGKGDYFNYIEAVPRMQTLHDVFFPVSYPFEISFRIITYINNILGLHPQFTIIVYNLISLTNIYLLIKKYSENKIISAFIYFLFLILFDMHHTRSAVAMGLVVRLFFLLLEKKYWKGLGVAALAFSFHRSSIVPICIIGAFAFMDHFIYKLGETQKIKSIQKYKPGLIIIGLVLLTAIFISPTKIMAAVLNLVPFENMKYQLNVYLQSELWSYRFSLIDPRFLLILGIYIMSIIFDDNESKEYRNLRHMMFLSVITIIVFSDSTMLVMRFYNYFNMFTIFMIPKILSKLRDIFSFEKYKIVYCSLLTTYFVYYFAICYIQVPYRLFFVGGIL